MTMAAVSHIVLIRISTKTAYRLSAHCSSGVENKKPGAFNKADWATAGKRAAKDAIAIETLTPDQWNAIVFAIAKEHAARKAVKSKEAEAAQSSDAEMRHDPRTSLVIRNDSTSGDLFLSLFVMQVLNGAQMSPRRKTIAIVRERTAANARRTTTKARGTTRMLARGTARTRALRTTTRTSSATLHTIFYS
jgi:hypothetical protein